MLSFELLLGKLKGFSLGMKWLILGAESSKSLYLSHVKFFHKSLVKSQTDWEKKFGNYFTKIFKIKANCRLWL